MTWISLTANEDTSAHVLLVYVLSSKTILPLACVHSQIVRRRTFVSQHQSNDQQPILAACTSLDLWRGHFQAVDEQQGQQDHVLGDLRRRKDTQDPFPKLLVGPCQRWESNNGRRWWSRSDHFGLLELVGRLKPEKTSHLCKSADSHGTGSDRNPPEPQNRRDSRH